MKIEIDEADLKQLYLFIEEVNDLFHQSARYKDSNVVASFADKNYSIIHKLYYETIWESLPEGMRNDLENR